MYRLKAKLEVEAALEKEKEKLTAEADAMGRLLEVAVADKEALEAKLQDKEQKHAEVSVVVQGTFVAACRGGLELVLSC